MKKSIFINAAFVALAMLASCAKEQLIDTSTVATGITEFTATIERTKTTIAADGKVTWNAGDEIVVTDAAYNTAVYVAESAGAITNFILKEGETAVGLAPYSATYGDIDNQVYDEVGANCPLTAAQTSSTIFKFSSPYAVVKITAKSSGSELIKSVDVNYGENKSTLSCGDGVTLTSEGKDFYVAVQPATDAALSVTFYTVDKMAKRTRQSVATLAAKDLLPVTFTFVESDWKVASLPGAFSVSANKQVQFSRGNLYVSNNIWGFFDKQYKWDINGNSDLFTWGYGEWSTDVTNAKYVTTHSEGEKLTADEDWASRIGDGTLWRTLTAAEWDYLIYKRDGAADKSRNGIAVCGQENCFVIAPDGFTGTIEDSYDSETWAAAEEAGLVCLPPAGLYQNGRIKNFGYYWSSTAASDTTAHFFNFEPRAATKFATKSMAYNSANANSLAANNSLNHMADFSAVKAEFIADNADINAAKASGINMVKTRIANSNNVAPTKTVSVNSTKSAGSDVNVTATDWQYDDYYYDVYLVSENTTYIFELLESTGGLTYGTTYTYADMYADWVCTLDDEGYPLVKATDATLTVTKDDAGLIHVAATMFLNGEKHVISYDEKPITQQRDTVDIVSTNLQYNDLISSNGVVIFYVNDVEGYRVFRVTSIATAVDGTFKWSENTINDPNSYFSVTGSDRNYFQDGEFTMATTDAGTSLTGWMIGKDEKYYRLNWSKKAGVLEYDTDAPFDATFGYSDMSTDLDEGVIYISATNAENLTMGLVLFTDPANTEIPAGTYVISDSEEAGTALKSIGVYGGFVTECWAGVRGASGISDCWFLVDGTITLSYDEYGKLKVEVDATNSWGQQVKISTYPGLHRSTGLSVRLVTDVCQSE